MKQERKDLEHASSEFRQRADTIECDEMWKTGKEEIEHAHEEGKEATSAAEAKAKELKEEEESVHSAAKDKLAALRKKMRTAQLARSPEQEKKRRASSNRGRMTSGLMETR
ncbi:hypothetical protein BLNAU_21918 [Blattamonas nauphoetae]|uniref:Uncharacterized protein n=1 Tax=Blattamonas nauphoetae TaxID=2049346 RepID=A0ABQ9WYS3_9EUKA|nr:hypothetical protein BLNAU_21918 [Blattamonas nauphoetae]